MITGETTGVEFAWEYLLKLLAKGMSLKDILSDTSDARCVLSRIYRVNCDNLSEADVFEVLSVEVAKDISLIESKDAKTKNTTGIISGSVLSFKDLDITSEADDLELAELVDKTPASDDYDVEDIDCVLGTPVVEGELMQSEELSEPLANDDIYREPFTSFASYDIDFSNKSEEFEESSDSRENVDSEESQESLDNKKEGNVSKFVTVQYPLVEVNPDSPLINNYDDYRKLVSESIPVRDEDASIISESQSSMELEEDLYLNKEIKTNKGEVLIYKMDEKLIESVELERNKVLLYKLTESFDGIYYLDEYEEWSMDSLENSDVVAVIGESEGSEWLETLSPTVLMLLNVTEDITIPDTVKTLLIYGVCADSILEGVQWLPNMHSFYLEKLDTEQFTLASRELHSMVLSEMENLKSIDVQGCLSLEHFEVLGTRGDSLVSVKLPAHFRDVYKVFNIQDKFDKEITEIEFV